MATLNATALESRARKAYEMGRLKRALRVLGVILPLVALSIYVCAAPESSVLVGSVLVVLAVGFLWRGEGWGRSVAPGLKAGVAAFLLPVTFHALGYCCRLDMETVLCLASGLTAGLVVGITGMRKDEDQRTTHLIGAGLIAAFAASLGCLALGIGGALGVAGGVFLVVTPFAVVSVARA